MASKYGITPDQVAEMPDDVLFDMVPGWAEDELAEKLGKKGFGNGNKRR